MPGVYAKRLYARTHTSGRTKSVQDAPTTNDHDCTDAKPTKHTQPFTGERGFRQGRRNKDTPSFKHGCLQVVEQSRCRTHRQQTTTVAQKQSQPSIHSLSRGKGVFGKDAEIRTHQALSMDAYKWSNKVGAGRTDNKRPLLHRSKANRVS